MYKINFVSRNFYPDCTGGCEKVFYEMYKRLKNDFDICIISGYNNPNSFPDNRSIFKHFKPRNRLLRYIYYTLNMSLRSLFKPADLIHANNIECLRLTTKPFILTVHHVEHFFNPLVRKQTVFNKILGKLLVWQANRADKVITVSKKTMNDLVDMGVKKEKIVVIPNGVDLAQFKPYPKIGHKKFIISHVSRISPEKAQHFTINAVKKLPERIRKNIELHIIGYVSDKLYYNNLERKDWIKYYTNVSEEELPRLISDGDLTVFPTIMSEGFGLVVLESMACKVPILASDQPGIREAGGRIAQYFKQGDIKDFNKKLLELYNSKSLREELSDKGLNWVKNYSWDNVYKEHKKLYMELLR